MRYLKIIGNLAMGFGVAFITFAVFSAIITFNLFAVASPSAPVNYVQFEVLLSMLPYMLLGVLSFIVAGIVLRETKENGKPVVQSEVAIEQAQA